MLLAALLEMYALLFTDNGILIHAPWFSLALLAVIVSLTAMVRSYAWRVAILTFVLVAILSVDAGFILLFDINGTAFDYSLLYQAADGLGMMEGQLVNFGFLVPGAIAVAGFLLYGVFNAVKLKDVKIEKNPRLRIVCCSLAGVLLVSALAVPNVLNFVNTTSDSYYADLLYDNDNEYKKYGVTGDVLYQFVTGPFLTSPKVATWQDSSEFYFRNKTENGGDGVVSRHQLSRAGAVPVSQHFAADGGEYRLPKPLFARKDGYIRGAVAFGQLPLARLCL